MSEKPHEKGTGGTLDSIRLSVARAQADGFAKLGNMIARQSFAFVVIPWLLMGSFAWGLYNVHIEIDPTKLWVQKGSRLEGEGDFYKQHFGQLPRGLAIQTTPKANTASNMMTVAHMAENYAIDGSILDMSPSRNAFWELIGQCATRNFTSCAGASFCGWNGTSTTSGSCIFQDKMGLLPSNQQKQSYTYRYLGVDWGWRELCDEVRVPSNPNNGVQRSGLSNARTPCSFLQTPMDCFLENPRSQQVGVLQLLGWNRRHSASYLNQSAYNHTLAGPCSGWQGTYNSKGLTVGGGTPSTGGSYNSVASYKLVYPLNDAKDFRDKYNNYIMKHIQSSIFYRQLGFPESITEDQASAILEGWEAGIDRHLTTVNNQMHLSELTWLSQWHVLDIIEEASLRNQTFVFIGLALMLVVVWMFLFRSDFVSSRLLLGLYGVLSVGMAIVGSMGFSALCSIDFNVLTLQVLPYVGMGLGIDDMFVLLHYFEENCKKTVTHRMEQCYAHAGPSICATTTINAFVFFLSALLPVKAIIDFALQAGVNVIFNFFMILFAFGGMMAIDARRIRNGGYDVVPCINRGTPGEPKDTHFTRTVTQTVMKPVVTDFKGQAIGLLCAIGLFGVGIYGATQITLGLALSEFVDSGSKAQKFLIDSHRFYRTEANFILGREGNWHTRENQIKLNNLVSNQLGNVENTIGLNGTLRYAEKTFLPQGAAWSQLFRSYALQYPGAQDANNSCRCYPPSSDWYDPTLYRHFPVDCTINPDMYYDLLALFMGQKTCLENGTTTPVNIKDPKYYPRCPGNAPHTIERITCQQAESSVARYGDLFIRLGPIELARQRYGYAVMSTSAHDVKFRRNAAGQTIPVAWKIGVTNNPVEQADVEATLRMMEETRSLLDRSGLPVFAWGGSYDLAEQYRFSKENLRLMLIVAVAGSFVLTAFLMASVTIALLQTIVIAMSVTTLVGCVRLLDLELNGVTLLSLAFGVGLNVEQCVHICRAFLVARPTNPKARVSEQNAERIMFALGEMSIPVFNGAFTSFMAIIVLSFSKTPFFRKYFFHLYAMMIVISLFYAFVPLPILLCIFGPSPLPPNVTHDGTEEEMNGSVDEEGK